MAAAAGIEAVEAEQRADNHADEHVNEGGEAVFADAGERGAVFGEQFGSGGFNFGQVFGQHV